MEEYPTLSIVSIPLPKELMKYCGRENRMNIRARG